MSAAQRISLENDPRAGVRFVAEDRELDRGVGPRHLGDPRIARIVAETLVAGEVERKFYELHAWCIMPNHVHILMTPKTDVSKIMRWIKGSTARAANLILATTGKRFWQDESWDRRVRNGGEFRKITIYIEENPVKAGLVTRAEDWPWSSASSERRR